MSGFQSSGTVTVIPDSDLATDTGAAGLLPPVTGVPLNGQYLDTYFEDAFAAGAQQATSRTLAWTGAANTLLSNVANWNDITGGTTMAAAAAPAAIDTVDFNVPGGGEITGASTVFAAAFSGGASPASWTLGTSSSLAVEGGGIMVGSPALSTLEIDAGASLDSFGVGDVVGAAATDSGVVHIEGAGAVWDATESVTIGASGTGALDVVGGGMVTALLNQTGAPALTLGADVSADGSLMVSGTGSDAVLTGQLNVGLAGGGHLLINGGATVDTGSLAASPTQGLDIAAAPGGTGDVTVAGTNSLLSNTGTFVVGDAGLGSLAVDAGGTVTTSANATIANSTSAAGSSANVTGGNFLVAGTLVDGNAGAGLLDIGPGGAVSALELDLGSLAGGAGVLTIDGPGASLNATNSLVVGVAGVGELSILDGASVTIGGDLDIGVGAGASGNVDIENTTGTTTINGGITLGAGGGVAVLTIGTLTDVVLNGGLFIGKHANLVKHTNFDPPPYLSNAGGDDEGSGVDSYKAYVQNTGAITQDQGGTLVLQTPTVYGAGGSFQINTGGSELDLNADGVSGQVFDFTDNTGTLVIGIDQLTTIDTPSSGTGPFTAEKNPNFGQLLIGGFGGTIAGMVAGDAVVLDTTAAAHISYAGGGSVVSVIDNAAGTQVGTLAFNSAALAAQIAVGSVSAKQLELVACFAAGTRIGTDRGPVAVESLQVGDAVTLAGGGAQTAVWIGSRTIDCARHPRPETVWPVCVARGAFGGNVPERALYLSPDHAVFVDGVLIPVKLLVNGTSITQMKRDHVTYYHVELPEHAVILAEGLAVESYLDTGDRYDFAADAGVIRLHPDFAARLAPNMARLWETRAAAPLVMTGGRLAAAREMIVPERREERQFA